MSKNIFTLKLYYNRELKFPKFVKDKELITLLKGMLTKNAMKRVLKLTQIKQSEYFKDFGWDQLLSFNLDPCYHIEMPQENLKEVCSYTDYIQDSLKDFELPKDAKTDSEYKTKVDAWFINF